MPAHDSEPLRVALALAARGVPSFPTVPDEKRPIPSRGVHDASTDPERLVAWWTRCPRANLAIATGARSGLVVLDLDVKRGADGRASLAALERDLGALPPTRTALTPSGGEHRYFRTAASAVIRNAAGRIAGEDAPGLDVRGDGGYVLAPPSVIRGARYVWAAARRAAELPVRWAAALSPPTRAVSAIAWRPAGERERSRFRAWSLAALAGAAREMRDAPVGTRNDRLWRAAARLGGYVGAGGLAPSEIVDALTWATMAWADRDERKDRSTIDRALRWGMDHPLEGGPRVSA